jgi:hypothetical protein
MDYYTIRHRDTDEPLGFGGPLDRGKALSILQMRRGLKLQEWCVTAWSGGGGEEDEIEYQISADEFVAAKGRPL